MKTLIADRLIEILYGISGKKMMISIILIISLLLSCDSNQQDKSSRQISRSDKIKEKAEQYIMSASKQMNLESIFQSRLSLVDNQFKLSLLLMDVKNNKKIISHNADQCFVAASLSKVMVTGVLFQLLQNDSVDLEKAFSNLVSKMINLPVEFKNGLKELLRSTNNYDIKTAPVANKNADDLLALIGCLIKKKNRFSRSRLKYGVAYVLDSIKKKPCNRMVNGSGLTLNNYFSASQVADELLYMDQYDIYKLSLMEPGSGMLKNRLPTFKGKAFFKTGSLRKSGVLCLAGYILDKKPDNNISIKQWHKKTETSYIIVAMINNIKHGQFDQTLKWLDETVKQLMLQSITKFK